MRASILLTVMLAASACSLEPWSPTVDGRRDAGPGRVDSGPMPGDGGGTCVEGSVQCSGDALVSCFGGREVVEDCQARSAFCTDDHCEDWACTPGYRECSGDRRSEIVCTARGDEIVWTECLDGMCSTVTNACIETIPPPPVCPGERPIVPGESVETDLCGVPDNRTFERVAPNCDTSLRAASGDEIFVLSLAAPTLLTFELTDVDSARVVDTILYIRTACEDATSQIACQDDVPCGTSTVPGGASCTPSGVDVRQSRVTLTLPAGRYYILADAFARRADGASYTCGRVRLSVRTG